MSRRTLWCAVLVLAGCAPGNPGLILAGALAPDDACELDTSGTVLVEGVLDVAPGRVSYTIHGLVFNQLINLSSTGGAFPPMADPNVITITHAEVELRDVQDNPLALDGLPNPYRVPAAGFIPSAEGNEAGSGIATVEAIPPLYGERLRASAGSRIIVAVRVLGVTAGGAEVLSAELAWPVEQCSGCLFACAVNDEGERLCAPSCRPGQDSLTISPAVCDGILASCIAG